MTRSLTPEESARLRHLETLRETYQKNVDHYEKVAGKYGGEDNMPVHMIHDLNSNRENLSKTKTEIAALRGQPQDSVRPPSLQPAKLDAVHLANLLLACNTMKHQDSRDTVINLLGDIAQRTRRNPNPLTDVTDLVVTCQNYDHGIEELIERVRSFEGNSRPMQKVDEYWNSL